MAQRSDIYGIIEEFRKFPLKIFGIKLGKEGCILTDFKEQVRLPAYPGIRVMDTTGAGDTFNASFLYGVSRGWTLRECAEFANAAAARAIGFMGARGGVATEAAVEQFKEQFLTGGNQS